MKATKSLLKSIGLIILLISSAELKSQTDSTALVEGHVYEIVDDEYPITGATVYLAKLDTALNVIDVDSILTGTMGEFSIEVDTGYYHLVPDKEYYEPILAYYTFHLNDSAYNLNFVMERPMLQMNMEQIEFTEPYNNPKQQKVVITNTGSGELVYSSNLYLYDKLPPDTYPTRIEINDILNLNSNILTHEKSVKSSRLVPQNDAWQLLFHDDQDQLPGNHDLSDIWMQKDDDNVYIKADFYEEIGSFDEFFFIFLLNTDRDYSTGEPGGGFDYAFVSSNFSGFIGTVIIQYIGTSWYYLMDAPYFDMLESNDYVAFGTNTVLFDEFDIMHAYALIRPGDQVYDYYDGIPDWQDGEWFFFSLESDPDINLNKFYGEVGYNESDTITLTLQPEIIDNPIDTFFIPIVCNDDSLPLRIIPVYIEKPMDTLAINNNSECSFMLNILPNPFSDVVTFSYKLSKPGKVIISIYQSDGKLVRNLVNSYEDVGVKTIQWDGTNNNGQRLNEGIYLYSILAEGDIHKGKLLMLK